jgi:hypothetical protein
MFHNDDHIRLMGCDSARQLVRRRQSQGIRERAKTTDWNAVFEKAGLSLRKR